MLFLANGGFSNFSFYGLFCNKNNVLISNRHKLKRWIKWTKNTFSRKYELQRHDYSHRIVLLCVLAELKSSGLSELKRGFPINLHKSKLCIFILYCFNE